jgi:hypothetical protein
VHVAELIRLVHGVWVRGDQSNVPPLLHRQIQEMTV